MEDTIYKKPSDHASAINNKNEHGFKVIFEYTNEVLKETIYYVKRNVRMFINDHVLEGMENKRMYPMLTFIKYYSKLAR